MFVSKDTSMMSAVHVMSFVRIWEYKNHHTNDFYDMNHIAGASTVKAVLVDIAKFIEKS